MMSTTELDTFFGLVLHFANEMTKEGLRCHHTKAQRLFVVLIKHCTAWIARARVKNGDYETNESVQNLSECFKTTEA